MGESSKIEWTHHTFNPWWGCTKVSAGCTHCYAESFSKRTGNAVWGDNAPRRFFGDKHWAEPLKWAAEARKAGHMRRVFCASMADVFEDRDDLEPHRIRLWKLIEATQDALDWLLLTKRPENIAKLGDTIVGQCWLGTTTENQETADRRMPHLLKHKARVHFVSAEPLLEGLVLRPAWTRVALATWAAGPIDWVIVGGESGGGARAFDVNWAHSLVEQCRTVGVACFVKQLGVKPLDFDGAGAIPLLLADRKGGDPNEWPADLRVRQFPEARQ